MNILFNFKPLLSLGLLSFFVFISHQPFAADQPAAKDIFIRYMAHGGISGACDELTIFHDKTAILKDQCWRHESTDIFTPENLKVDNLVTYLKSLNHGFEKSWWDVFEQTIGGDNDMPDGADQIQYVLEFEGKSLDYKKLSSEEQQKISELISPIFESGQKLYKSYEMDDDAEPYVPPYELPIQTEESLPVPLGMEGYQPPPPKN